MSKKSGSKIDLVRKFLLTDPQGTFKDFDKATPGVLSSSYFATMKSQLKKKGELALASGAKVKRAPRKAAGIPPVNGSLSSKVADQRAFLDWVDVGIANGYVDKLKDHLA